MKLFQIGDTREEMSSAWSKAPNDVAAVAKKLGFATVDVSAYDSRKRLPMKIQHLLWYVRCFFGFGMERGSACLMQHPQLTVGFGRFAQFDKRLLFSMFKRRGIKLILIIHDVGSWRKFISDDNFDDEIKFFAEVPDAIIVHNEIMKQRLEREGVPADKMVVLSVFDYLVKEELKVTPARGNHDVIIAGNLRPDKVPYLKGLASVSDVQWHLFGKRFDENHISAANIHYEGCYSAEEVHRHLNLGFGLVWDGDSVDTCSGNTGTYLKYNNPHKFSLYLASGLPVIVWTESAIADFVKQHDVGICVSSMREIGEALDGISEDRYKALVANVRRIGSKLRTGCFIEAALKTAIERVNK